MRTFMISPFRDLPPCQIRLCVMKIYEKLDRILLNNFRNLLSIIILFKGCGTVIGKGVRGGGGGVKGRRGGELCLIERQRGSFYAEVQVTSEESEGENSLCFKSLKTHTSEPPY